MIFVALVTTVMTVLHVYLWYRLVAATTLRGTRARRVLTWCVVGLWGLATATLMGTRVDWLREVTSYGFLWIAVVFYLFVFLAVLEVPRALAAPVARRLDRRAAVPPDAVPMEVGAETAGARTSDAGPPSPIRAGAAPSGAALEERPDSPRDTGVISRRLFLGRTAAAVAGAGALTTVGFGVRSALGDPVIERVTVTLPRLDARLDGLTFAVVGDIHLGPLTGPDRSRRIVRMINELEADVVAIVGDMVDDTVARLGALARPFASLESRYGAYFVTGNHEYYVPNGPAEWIEELRELGIRPLRNERVEIEHGGAVLDLAGVNDVNGASYDEAPDYEAALAGRDAARTSVLLAHQPVQAVEASRYAVDLQLSGHTHGGQMAPLDLIVPLQQPVLSGLGRVGDTQVYVTRGAGFWGPPVRVGSPPEITLLRLRAPRE
ncbi:metallophosphoesterase [Thermostaphylospora chromogena]|uniref:Calcineurin-like phosphoesterase domain-containing protein n=1 Tax=Thermostaphylospora chromogena TaxID=35622 RepID=A0A1H1C7E1_9ACTN|nr:metallophosphoesterase [Thermostaphylospora chromogena]SDQ60095.1 hypothetical protein SAMN04489764_1335 [Thermostaphylospora chromogena]